MFTGLRIGEALALKWSSVDFQKKTLTVNSNLTSSHKRDKEGNRGSRELLEGSVKTDSGNRMVALSEIALDALSKIKKQKSNSEFIFATEADRHPDPKSIRRTLNLMQKNCNTKILNSGLHVLRHTFASMLIRNGVDIKVVSALLGHKKVSTTYDIYVSLIPKQKQDAMILIDSKYKRAETK